MKKYGFKISGCLGDIVNATPVFKYVSRCHNQKLSEIKNLVIKIYDDGKLIFKL